ncbi:MAG: CopD family protein [Acidimicrobiia bacterium]
MLKVMLPVTTSTIRLFLHVLAATVWVGGQLTLAGLVPGLRDLAPDAPRSVARRFNLIAWPAFAVLVATGIWNIVAIDPNWSSSYGTTLIVKIVVVAGSGITAFVHTRSRSRRGLAVFGALSGITALAALFLGIMLG